VLLSAKTATQSVGKMGLPPMDPCQNKLVIL
jgi:hypothetical protein